MICTYCQENLLDQFTDEELEKHVANCPYCRDNRQLDAEIMQRLQELPRFKPSETVWINIENRTIKKSVPFSKAVWLRAAAVLLVLCVSLALYLIFSSTTDNNHILSDNALKQVEHTEKQYEQAISELEKQAAPKLASTDRDLQFLYRDKLETIDNQIQRCKEALATNPGNAHIRRYLLTALRDKKATLLDIISSAAEVNNKPKITG